MKTKKELQEENKNLLKYKERYNFLTKGGKYKDTKARIEAQLEELKKLNDYIESSREEYKEKSRRLNKQIQDLREKYKKSEFEVNTKKIYAVLDFLVKKEILPIHELAFIILRYHKLLKQKRITSKLDITLVGIEKIANHYKEEINIENAKNG